MGYLGAFTGIAFLIIGIVQAIVGYLGIEYHLGTLAAVIAILIAFFFRIMLPLTIGTFFGALNVLNWHWFGALILTIPGLLFVVPAMVTAAIGSLMQKQQVQSTNFSFTDNFTPEVKNVTPNKVKKRKTIKRKKKKR
tara:strand:- start:272 stop:682 length:411 start_codon:yes stop_codon:yes gene_type:complete